MKPLNLFIRSLVLIQQMMQDALKLEKCVCTIISKAKINVFETFSSLLMPLLGVTPSEKKPIPDPSKIKKKLTRPTPII